MGEEIALVAPVDLGLRTWDDFEAAVQPGQWIVVGLGQPGGDPRSGFGQEHLDPLIVTAEPILGDQPLMDHRAFDGQIGAQPPLHHRYEWGDHQWLRPSPWRTDRRNRGGVLGQIGLGCAFSRGASARCPRTTSYVVLRTT
jgi:hypothetical protein